MTTVDARLPHPSPAPAARRSLPDRWLQNRLEHALRGLSGGRIQLDDASGRRTFGSGGDLEARVVVHDPRFYRSVALGGVLGASESWMRGEWTCNDPTALVRLMLRNAGAMAGLGGTAARVRDRIAGLARRLAGNNRSRSRRNVQSHYDLGNDFFEQFLDPTLTYSCGVFEREDTTLEEASIAKYDRLCRKLALSPSDRVLEIGSGWGGFAIHAASRYGCHVTTTTLSARQLEVARARVAAAGLSDRVEVLHEDYRDLRGRFDKLVSVEMVEAVGREHLGTYLETCAARLEPHGAMALQAITIDDRHYERAARTVDFIKRYVFPGGFLPSVTAIAAEATRRSDLRISHLEELTPHYAETLRRWREGFRANLQRIRELGYADELLRMWEFYLAYCEGGFEERHIGLVQMVLTKPGPAAAPAWGALGGRN